MAFTLSQNAWCKDIVKGLKFRKVNVSGNGTVNFAIDAYGRVWSWGRSSAGQAGQGNYNYDSTLSGNARWAVFENFYIVSPRLVRLADGTVKDDWVKFNVGELGAMGIDKDGALWGAGLGSTSGVENCGAFGLPHDSGEDQLEWKVGVNPRVNYQYWFFNFTRCAPGYTFKDFVYCYYYTLMIGQDDKLYFMGEDDNNGVNGLPLLGTLNYNTPTLVQNVPTNIKLLATTAAFNYDMYGFVTNDNKVYGVGSGIYDWFDPAGSPPTLLVYDLTHNLPDIEIVYMSAGYNAMFVTLINGDVYGMGPDYLMGQDTGDHWYEWVKIPVSNIRYCEHSQDGAFAIDNEGYLWTWGYPQYGKGFEEPNCYNAFFDYSVEGVGIATKRRWKSVKHDYYNTNWAGIDIHGNLRAWGWQGWGPHLGIGTNAYQSTNDIMGIELAPVIESCTPILCTIPNQSSIDFHWPRAVPTPTPFYRNRS